MLAQMKDGMEGDGLMDVVDNIQECGAERRFSLPLILSALWASCKTSLYGKGK